MMESSLLARLRETCARAPDGAPEAPVEAALGEITRAFDAITCTLHRADPSSRSLHLVAAKGLPAKVLEATRVIPYGRGMAGICAERHEPVTVCNLQTDPSGVVRPGARETRVAGALVVPVLAGDALRGVLGIGKAHDHDYSTEEIALLGRCGEVLMGLL